MLSFMNRGNRRKAKKVDIASIRRLQSPPSPASFASPEIVDIVGEKLDADQGLRSPHGWGRDAVPAKDDGEDRLDSPKVQLEISSEPLSTFFPPDLLRDSSPPARPNVIGQEARVAPTRNDSRRALGSGPLDIMVIGSEGGQPSVPVLHEEEPKETSATPPRKLPPAPIRIPSASGSRFHIHRSASEATKQLHPDATNDAPSQPGTRPASFHDGDADMDNLSTISGTTLARALITNSFILTTSESRHSRYRSGGMTRQDSATLPKGEHPYISSPYWRDRHISASGEIVQTPAPPEGESSIPPVPPVPTLALIDARSRPGSSAGESDQEAPTVPPNARRISRISEAPSPAPSTPEPSTAASSVMRSADASGNGTSPSHYNSPGHQDSTPPSSAPLSSSRLPASGGYSVGSGEDIGHILDDFQFLSPMGGRFVGAPSPDPNSASSSMLSVPLPGRPRSMSQPRDSSLSGKAVYTIKPPELNVVRTRSDSRSSQTSRDKYPQRSLNLLPIGERPRSAAAPNTPDDDTRPSTSGIQQRLSRMARSSVLRSAAAKLPPIRSSTDPEEPSLTSPDPLDTILLPVTRSIFNRQRSGSVPDPIRVVREPPYSRGIPIDEDTDEHASTASGTQQTFPETPRMFSPLWSANADTPPVPAVPQVVRRISVTAVPSASRGLQVERPALTRAATTSAATAEPATRPRVPSTPPPTADNSLPPSPNTQVIVVPARAEAEVSALAVRTPLPPSPQPEAALSAHEQPSEGSSSSYHGQSSSEKSRTVDAPLDTHTQPTTPRIHETPASPETPVSARQHGLPAPLPRPPRTPPEEPSFMATFVPPPPYQAAVNDQPLRVSAAPEYSLPPTTPVNTRRQTRSRPPLPIGPRRPSQHVGGLHNIASIGRERNGSVSSFVSNGAPQGQHRPGTPSSSSIRFQTLPVRFRGYTIDMAKWNFTSEQLQGIVSRAIRHSSQASSIRLLSLDVLDHELPEELSRLETLAAELKTRYKLLARKRTALLGTLTGQSDHAGAGDYSPRHRTMEDLSETSTSLDQVVEELYLVTDQIQQLRSLVEVHSSSALAMALRKLNTSYAKKSAEAESLRARVAALEAERDEAWKQAEEVAHEFDDLQERVNETNGAQTPSSAKSPGPSRRSSRVLVARKTSLRASKAGLRTSGGRRSQRLSSSSSQRLSLVPSAARSTFSMDDVPPVPPIPRRRPGIVTADLASRASMGVSSGGTALSATRDMVEAQLCDMLGIAVNDLGPDGRASRPMSIASLEDAARSTSPPLSPRPRRASLPANVDDLGKIYDAMSYDPAW